MRPGRAEILLLLVSALATLAALEGAIRAGWVPLPDYVLSDGWQRERWHRREAAVATSKRIDRYDAELGWKEPSPLPSSTLTKPFVNEPPP